MTDQHAELDAALERVIAAARGAPGRGPGRRGRASTTTTSGRRTSRSTTPRSPTTSSCSTRFGEVTPWDVEAIDPDEADQRFGAGLGGADGGADRPAPAGDLGAPAPRLPGAERGRAAPGRRGGPARRRPRTRTSRSRSSASARRCWSCCRPATARSARWTCRSWSRSTAWSWSAEVGTPLDLEAFDDDRRGPARSSRRADDRLVGRLDEHPFLDSTRSTTTPATGTDGPPARRAGPGRRIGGAGRLRVGLSTTGPAAAG